MWCRVALPRVAPALGGLTLRFSIEPLSGFGFATSQGRGDIPDHMPPPRGRRGTRETTVRAGSLDSKQTSYGTKHQGPCSGIWIDHLEVIGFRSCD